MPLRRYACVQYSDAEASTETCVRRVRVFCSSDYRIAAEERRHTGSCNFLAVANPCSCMGEWTPAEPLWMSRASLSMSWQAMCLEWHWWGADAAVDGKLKIDSPIGACRCRMRRIAFKTLPYTNPHLSYLVMSDGVEAIMQGQTKQHHGMRFAARRDQRASPSSLKTGSNVSVLSTCDVTIRLRLG